MDLFALTRALVDIESTTPSEGRVSEFLYQHLAPMANRFGGKIERMPVESGRENIFVSFGTPIVTLSTHMDTVPPFFASSEDDTHIRGRGSCDAKGIIAAMIEAAHLLIESGTTNIGLLFVVGEERNSAGALAAAKISRGARFIINGEPTENRLALGSKGSLRYQITARGRMAHSAYPELGESAIEKLLDVLADLRRMPMPSDPLLGASTLNIGTIEGGRAPNVIPDYARAEILIRLVDDPAPIQQAVTKISAGRVEAEEVLCIPLRQARLARWLRNNRRRIYHGHSSIRRRVGHAIFNRPRHDSRCAHQRRAHRKARLTRRRGNLHAHGEATSIVGNFVMIVMKFGGTSLESAEALARVASVISARRVESPFVVVSAMGKTTNELIAICHAAAEARADDALARLARLREYHLRESAPAVGASNRSALEEILEPHFRALSALVDRIATARTIDPVNADDLASFGERLSSQIVTLVLKHSGINAHHLDARQLIVTDARHTRAPPCSRKKLIRESRTQCNYSRRNPFRLWQAT